MTDQLMRPKDGFTAAKQFALASTAPPTEFGTTPVHIALEKALTKSIGKEAAIVYNMGYATNATSIPALTSKGKLILSDARPLSVVHVPRTHRPWKKIIVMFEGIYSIEREVVRLRELVDVTKKYKNCNYMDKLIALVVSANTRYGWIAASEEIINFICNSSSGAPVIAQQILMALNIFAGWD
ncbi:Serine palmitoyltransferase [Phytophthora palmivora]|uniref:Serine palmitoyltransferase n=1 Tax=Phytophthora palmivora TaxID=4796 RepID=A0A2P4XTS2_9STRA|nr:Serine palmitoyltransferase [Phytophthora palmivora]